MIRVRVCMVRLPMTACLTSHNACTAAVSGDWPTRLLALTLMLHCLSTLGARSCATCRRRWASARHYCWSSRRLVYLRRLSSSNISEHLYLMFPRLCTRHGLDVPRHAWWLTSRQAMLFQIMLHPACD